jgi:hypothetical protein
MLAPAGMRRGDESKRVDEDVLVLPMKWGGDKRSRGKRVRRRRLDRGRIVLPKRREGDEREVDGVRVAWKRRIDRRRVDISHRKPNLADNSHADGRKGEGHAAVDRAGRQERDGLASELIRLLDAANVGGDGGFEVLFLSRRQGWSRRRS